MTCFWRFPHFFVLADWNKHGYGYNCNALDTIQGTAAVNAKRELDRYIHYYKRWNEHRVSLKFALSQVRICHDQLLAFSNESAAPNAPYALAQSSIAKQHALPIVNEEEGETHNTIDEVHHNNKG